MSSIIVDEPPIVSRGEWGAMPPRYGFNETHFPPTNPRTIVLHHTAGPNYSAVGPGCLVRGVKLSQSIQQAHMFSNGWADSGMHFLITRDGLIFEGRAGSLDGARSGHCVRGAHCYDPDRQNSDRNDSWGIEHEGLYTTSAMPDVLWKASVWLSAWLCQQTHLDSATIIGHRDSGCSTQCPGDWFHGRLEKYRSEVHAKRMNG